MRGSRAYAIRQPTSSCAIRQPSGPMASKRRPYRNDSRLTSARRPTSLRWRWRPRTRTSLSQIISKISDMMRKLGWASSALEQGLWSQLKWSTVGVSEQMSLSRNSYGSMLHRCGTCAHFQVVHFPLFSGKHTVLCSIVHAPFIMPWSNVRSQAPFVRPSAHISLVSIHMNVRIPLSTRYRIHWA